jgi:hypothetical protein
MMTAVAILSLVAVGFRSAMTAIRLMMICIRSCTSSA